MWAVYPEPFSSLIGVCLKFGIICSNYRGGFTDEKWWLPSDPGGGFTCKATSVRVRLFQKEAAHELAA